MPLERFVLIIVIVMAAAAATVWVGVLITSALTLPPWATLATAIPAALVAYVIWRTIAERLSSRDDDHYDGMKH